MSKTEDYLDSLLNSVSSGRTGMSESRSHRRMGMESIEDFEDKITDVDVEEYEKQLNEADMDTFVRDFETEVDNSEDDVVDVGDGDHFFDNLEGVIKSAREKAEAKKHKDAYGFGADFASDEDDSVEEDMSAEDTSVSDTDDAKKVNADIPDEAKEIIDMLAEISGDEELANIGKSLQAGEIGVNENEDGASVELSDLETESKKEKKPKKKKGFFKKISSVLFGDENEESGELEEVSGAEAEQDSDEYQNMSDEEIQILKELQATENVSDETETKEDKKKKKKEKKEKKEKKPKKEKQPKEPKPKKAPKPKEVDLSPPLPKKPVILIFVMGLSVLALILLFSNHLGYSVSVTEAKTAFKEQDYVGAYHELSGLTLKDADSSFYERVFLLAKVQEEFRSGEVLFTTGEYAKSLDSYICALGRYEANYQEALDFGIQLEYDALAEQVVKRMEENFGVTADEAKELYALYDREEYTVRVYDIVKGLGLIETDSEE